MTKNFFTIILIMTSFMSCSRIGSKRNIASDTTGNPIQPEACTIHLQTYGIGDKDDDGLTDDPLISKDIKPTKASSSTQDYFMRKLENLGYQFVDNEENAKFQLALGLTYRSHIQEYIWGKKVRTADYEIALEILNSHNKEIIVQEYAYISGDGKIRQMTEERAAKKFYRQLKNNIPSCD